MTQEHPTTTLKCRYPGCDAVHTFDVADQIPAAWRCRMHRPPIEPTISQEPLMAAIQTGDQEQYQKLVDKAFTDLVMLMAFNKWNEVSVRNILIEISSQSVALGFKDAKDQVAPSASH